MISALKTKHSLPLPDLLNKASQFIDGRLDSKLEPGVARMYLSDVLAPRGRLRGPSAHLTPVLTALDADQRLT